MKKQLLLLALALGTTSLVMSNATGKHLINYIQNTGLETLTNAQKNHFDKIIKNVKKEHPEQLNGYYEYRGVQVTPLMLAAYYVNPDLTNYLLVNGADGSLTSKGAVQTQAQGFITLELPKEKKSLKTQLHNLKNPSSNTSAQARTNAENLLSKMTMVFNDNQFLQSLGGLGSVENALTQAF